jgi:hypothetical protein
VYLGSISAGLAGFSAYSNKKSKGAFGDNAIYAKAISLGTLGCSILIILYAARRFYFRDVAMARQSRSETFYADNFGPGFFAGVVLVTLLTMFISSIKTMATNI